MSFDGNYEYELGQFAHELHSTIKLGVHFLTARSQWTQLCEIDRKQWATIERLICEPVKKKMKETIDVLKKQIDDEVQMCEIRTQQFNGLCVANQKLKQERDEASEHAIEEERRKTKFHERWIHAQHEKNHLINAVRDELAKQYQKAKIYGSQCQLYRDECIQRGMSPELRISLKHPCSDTEALEFAQNVVRQAQKTLNEVIELAPCEWASCTNSMSI